MAERIRNGEDTVLDDATVKSIIESANQNNTNKYYSELTDTSIKKKKEMKYCIQIYIQKHPQVLIQKH